MAIECSGQEWDALLARQYDHGCVAVVILLDFHDVQALKDRPVLSLVPD